jgi:hypothetical protein
MMIGMHGARRRAVIFMALSAASCATHVNHITVRDGLATPLDAHCVQEVIRALPGNRPSLEPSQWQTDIPMSGDVASWYAFALPDVDGLPGPTGDALYWVHVHDVSDFFSRDRHGLVFMSVVWTEPYPESEARAVRFEDSLVTVRARILERCGGTLIDIHLPKCERQYENGTTALTRPCVIDISPNNPLQPTRAAEPNEKRASTGNGPRG